MSDLKEKVAYLQGLADGLELDEDSKEAKLCNSIIEVLAEMASSIEDLESYVEALDEDLGLVEDDLYGEEGDEDYDEADYARGNCQGKYIEVACPKCHEIVNLDSCMLEDDNVTEITCPNCDELLHVNENSNLQMSDNADQQPEP
ncbi:MAG TPA: AraC family transcriptional regulator [Peptococcaceae bacterium]|nr:AraC family transcriptional regulator [Peptococcaceae bacterium]HPZ71982.1 AraC family transcriptional regulator [Peptococcaceae bacterium]HQD53614.1 AraC family transcriptional regulator [Peptococcaceae bacterium]